MSNTDNGGPAFPRGPIGQDCNRPYGEQAGMSLRQWYAGQALASAIEDYGQPSATSISGQRTDRGNPILPYATKGTGTREEIIARQAFRYADAMLAVEAEGGDA